MDSNDDVADYHDNGGYENAGSEYGAGETADEMYSAEPNTTSIDGLRGKELLIFTENVIRNVMLIRSDVLAPPAWQGVITQNSSDPMISLSELQHIWSGTQSPLTERDITALFTRFGSPFEELQHTLRLAADSNVNRSYLSNESYQKFSSKSVKELYTRTAAPEINQNLLHDFLHSWGEILNTVEIQISRSDNTLIDSDLTNRNLSPKTIKNILNSLGITGINFRQIQPILKNALNLSGESQPGPETGAENGPELIGLSLLDLQSYCRARMLRKEGTRNQGPRSVVEFNSLLKPFTHPYPSKHTKNSRHILKLFLNCQIDQSGGVPCKSFLSAMRKSYPHINSTFLEALSECIKTTITNRNNKNESNDVIFLDNFVTFCYPKGFQVSVLMSLGSFKAKNSKIKALDSTDKLYLLAKKQLFFNLRKSRHSDPSLKYPEDLKLFFDANYTRLIPNSADVLLIDIIDDNTKLYGKSEYVTDLFELDSHEKVSKEMLENNMRSSMSAENINSTSNFNFDTSVHNVVRPLGASRSENNLKRGNKMESLIENRRSKGRGKGEGLNTGTNYYDQNNNQSNTKSTPNIKYTPQSYNDNDHDYNDYNDIYDDGNQQNNPVISTENDMKKNLKNASSERSRAKANTEIENTKKNTVPAGVKNKNTENKKSEKSFEGNKSVSEKVGSHTELDLDEADFGSTFYAPPAPPFFGQENEAHLWGIPLTIKYLKDVLELGEYEESFLRCETTGYKFMCLDESNIVPLQITHNTHKAKILGHSGKIRQIVFEKAVMGRPVDPITWLPHHIASWISIKKNCPNAALKSLQLGLSGADISKFSYPDLLDKFGGVGGSGENELAIRALMGLYENHKNSNKENELSESNDVEDNGAEILIIKNRKGSEVEKAGQMTAIKLRRKESQEKDLLLENLKKEVEKKEENENKIKNEIKSDSENQDTLNVSPKLSSSDNLKKDNVEKKSDSNKIFAIVEGDEFFKKNEDNPTEKTKKALKKNKKKNEKVTNVVQTLDPLIPENLNSVDINHVNEDEREKNKEIERKKLMQEEIERINEMLRVKDREKEKEKERLEKIKFENKINALQDLVENQSKSVSELRKLTASLRSDKLAAMLVIQESEKEKINLIKSRDETANKLEKLSYNYINDMEIEKQKLNNELISSTEYEKNNKNPNNGHNENVEYDRENLRKIDERTTVSAAQTPSPVPSASTLSTTSSSRNNHIENKIVLGSEREKNNLANTSSNRNQNNVLTIDENQNQSQTEKLCSDWRQFLDFYNLNVFNENGFKECYDGFHVPFCDMPGTKNRIKSKRRMNNGDDDEDYMRKKGVVNNNEENYENIDNNRRENKHENWNENQHRIDNESDAQSNLFYSLLRITACRWSLLGHTILKDYKILKHLKKPKIKQKNNDLSDSFNRLHFLKGLCSCAYKTCANMKRSECLIEKTEDSEECSSAHSDEEVAFAIVLVLGLVWSLIKSVNPSSASHQSTSVTRSNVEEHSERSIPGQRSPISESQAMFLLNQIKGGNYGVQECSSAGFQNILQHSLCLPFIQHANIESSQYQLLWSHLDPLDKNMIKAQHLFMSFQHLVPMSNQLNMTSKYPLEIIFKMSREKDPAELLMQQQYFFLQLDHGQKVVFFLLSAVANRMFKQADKKLKKEIDAKKIQKHDSSSVYRALYDNSLEMVKIGAKKGIQSYQRFLDSCRKNSKNIEDKTGIKNETVADLLTLQAEFIYDILYELACPIAGENVLSSLPSVFFKIEIDHPTEDKKDENLRRKNSKIEPNARVGLNKIKKSPEKSPHKTEEFEGRGLKKIASDTDNPEFLFLNIFRFNLRNICLQCARMLNVYGQSSIYGDMNTDFDVTDKNQLPSNIMSRFMDIILKFQNFRMHCLQQKIKNVPYLKERSSVSPQRTLSSSISSPKSLNKSLRFEEENKMKNENITGNKRTNAIPNASMRTLPSFLTRIEEERTLINLKNALENLGGNANFENFSVNKDRVGDTDLGLGPDQNNRSDYIIHLRNMVLNNSCKHSDSDDNINNKNNRDKINKNKNKNKDVDNNFDGNEDGNIDDYSYREISFLCGMPFIESKKIFEMQNNVENVIYHVNRFIELNESILTSNEINNVNKYKIKNKDTNRTIRDIENLHSDIYISSDEDDSDFYRNSNYKNKKTIKNKRNKNMNDNDDDLDGRHSFSSPLNKSSYDSTLQSLRNTLNSNFSGGESGDEFISSPQRKLFLDENKNKMDKENKTDDTSSYSKDKVNHLTDKKSLQDLHDEKSNPIKMINISKTEVGKDHIDLISNKSDSMITNFMGVLLRYLDSLNENAENRQKIIQSLLMYNNNSKKLIEINRKSESNLNDNRVKERIQDYSINVKIIKKNLVDNNRQTVDPEIMTFVRTLREDLKKKDFMDRMSSIQKKNITSALREIKLLEDSLEISFNDAVNLSDKIINNLLVCSVRTD